VPATSELVRELVSATFAREEVCVVTGDAGVAQRFTRLPFDHLVFTGSTAVGRHVMRAAAENLVPVTLELGGKCPVIVGRSADMPSVAMTIAQHKLFNAGQICLAPDYVLAPRDAADRLVAGIEAAAATMYPDVATSPDVTGIIDARHYARLRGCIDDARSRGARIVEVNPTGASAEALAAMRRMPLTIVRDVRDDMLLMQEEIFGPVLPIVEYDSIVAAIAYVNARPRPLALYWFGARCWTPRTRVASR
jgi:coniferyl-aldehyde dehydrogenase